MTQQRFLHEDDSVVEFGNSFGHIALWTMSFFLLAVSRHTPLLQNQLVKWHSWPGRIVVLSAVCHGIVHLYRWNVILKLNLVFMLIPSRQCWTGRAIDTPSQDECLDPITGCSCYHVFRNLAGFCAMVGMIMIGLTSLYKIRRRYYRFFYLIHATIAPLSLLLLCLHFTRSLIYMAPSILYYMACSFPVLMETLQNWKCGVKILSCQKISDDCFVLTFEASSSALQQYKPGQHVLLRAPNISLVSHPFTVNQVLVCHDGEDNTSSLCIMIRQSGIFTKSLATTALLDNSKSFPKIQLDGYYGSTQRLEQVLRHDVVLMIAGGIGIVSYLSLLHNVIQDDGAAAPITRIVKLHWACRDAALVRFVKSQYLNRLLQQVTESDTSLEVTIYMTLDDNLVESCTFVDDADNEVVSQHHNNNNNNDDDNIIPFTPSRFSMLRSRRFGKFGSVMVYTMNLCIGGFVSYYVCVNALKEEDSAATVWMYVCVAGMWIYTLWIAQSMDSRYIVMFASVVWLGLFVVWYLYLNVQDENSNMLQRLWSPVCIVVLAAVVAILSTCRSDDMSTTEYKPVDQNATGGIELGDFVVVNKNVAEHESMANGRISTASNTITTERGRPSILNLLTSSIAATTDSNVGVFACGPVSLMEDVRSSVSLLRHGCCCSSRRQCTIDLYEETFEM